MFIFLNRCPLGYFALKSYAFHTPKWIKNLEKGLPISCHLSKYFYNVVIKVCYILWREEVGRKEELVYCLKSLLWLSRSGFLKINFVWSNNIIPGCFLFLNIFCLLYLCMVFILSNIAIFCLFRPVSNCLQKSLEAEVSK